MSGPTGLSCLREKEPVFVAGGIIWGRPAVSLVGVDSPGDSSVIVAIHVAGVSVVGSLGP